MTRSVARPSRLGAYEREIFTEALLLATAFFVHCLKIFCAKDVSPLETDREKRVSVAETISPVSSYTVIE